MSTEPTRPGRFSGTTENLIPDRYTLLRQRRELREALKVAHELLRDLVASDPQPTMGGAVYLAVERETWERVTRWKVANGPGSPES